MDCFACARNGDVERDRKVARGALPSSHAPLRVAGRGRGGGCFNKFGVRMRTRIYPLATSSVRSSGSEFAEAPPPPDPSPPLAALAEGGEKKRRRCDGGLFED